MSESRFTLKLRITVVPKGVSLDKRLHFAALITPMVCGKTDDPVALASLPVLSDWPNWIGLPFASSDVPPIFSIVAGQRGAMQPAIDARLDMDWWKAISWNTRPPLQARQKEMVNLWSCFVDQAWIAPEPRDAVGATEVRTPERADTQILSSDKRPRAVDLVANAAKLASSTLDALTTDSLNSIAGKLFTARAVNVDFPGTNRTLNDDLEQYRFLLKRQERLGSAGESNQAQNQKTAAANAAQKNQEIKRGSREFHQLVSAIGDHGALLRCLGLAFDFSIARTPDLQAGRFLIGVTLPLPQPFVVNDDLEVCALVDLQNMDCAGFTACEVAGNELFPCQGSTLELEANGQSFAADHFDTVEWDVIAALRSALREKDFASTRVPSSPAGAVRPPFVDLVSHGISIFRKPTYSTIDIAHKALTQKRTPRDEFGRAWMAEDLIRGYLIEVSRSRRGDNWSQWKSLTDRKVSYSIASDKSKTFSVRESAPVSLALTEGLQPLSGWLLRPLEIAGRIQAIQVSPTELEQLGVARERQPFVMADCYLLQTQVGNIIIADVPDINALQDWKSLPLLPNGPIASSIRRSTVAGSPYLFGQFVDLEGIVSTSTDGPNNVFLATKARFLRPEEGFGVAGEIVDPLPTFRATMYPNSTSIAFVENVFRVRRAACRLEQDCPDSNWSERCLIENRNTFVHLRRRVASSETNKDPESLTPVTRPEFNQFVNNPAANGLKSNTLFIQGRGEFALSVASGNDVHVASAYRASGQKTIEEEGEINLQFRSRDASGKLLFSLVADDGPLDPEQFQPVTLDPAGINIQTLTSAAAGPGELISQATFTAKLRRDVEGNISVTSLTEIVPATEAIIAGFMGSDRITLQLPEAPNGLIVEVHPQETIVECAEAVPAASAPPPAAAANAPDETISVSDDLDGTGSTGSAAPAFIRGPWAEQGTRLQVGDRCSVQLSPPQGASNLRRANRIRMSAREPNRVFTGFLTDANENATDESRYVFKPLATTTAGENGNHAATGHSVIIDDYTRIVSSPGVPGQPWRYAQGPPPSGTLVKLFLASDFPANTKSPVHVEAVEILNGLHGRMNVKADWPKFTLTLSGFAKPLDLELSDSLQKDLTEKLKQPTSPAAFLDGRQVGVRFSTQNSTNERGPSKSFVSALDLEVHLQILNDHQVHVISGPNSFDIEFDPVRSNLKLPNGQKPSDNDVVQASLAWVQSLTPAVQVTKIVRAGVEVARVRVQVVAFDANTHRAEVLIIAREGGGSSLPRGTRVPLYFETAVDMPGESPVIIEDHLEQVRASGLPLDVDAVETMVVDDTPDSDQVLTLPSSKLHQWSIFAWPGPTSVETTLVHDGLPSFAMFWLEPSPSLFFRPSPTAAVTSSSVTPTNLRLVAGLSDGHWQPIVGGDIKVDRALNLPRRPTIISHFLPDQIVVDDAVAHWFGRSLAVGLPGKPGLVSDKPAANSHEQFKIETDLAEKSCIPLRFGWNYRFRLRPIFLTGDSPQISEDLPPNENLPFRPFGSLVPTPSLPFLRFESISPPRIGWLTADRKKGFPTTNGWGDPLDLRILNADDVGTCPNPDGTKPSRRSRRSPVIEIHAPEAPFRLAELCGFLDGVYQAKGKSIPELYELLRIHDQAPDKLPGSVPDRLPDMDADHALLEIRAFGDDEKEHVRIFPLPSFGAEPKKWVQRDHSTATSVLRLLPLPSPSEDSVPGRTLADLKVDIAKGEIRLPRDGDYEITLRAVPTAAASQGSEGYLALIRLLRALSDLPNDSQSDALAQLKVDGMTKGGAKKALEHACAGRHPMLSRGVTIRIRHMTARPAQFPTKDNLLLAERLPGATSAVFDGRYRIDRPSTGRLIIQAATEIPYDDSPTAPLPRVPRAELQRILPIEQQSAVDKASTPRKFFGCSLDRVREITSDEFAISQITPVAPSTAQTAAQKQATPIPQLGPETEQIRYVHELGDSKHRTVFYRPLAISRFLEVFGQDECAPNPCPGPYDYPKTEKDFKGDAVVPWHAVEIPATVRPAPPVIKDQTIIYEWDPYWEEDGAWMAGRNDVWKFNRTRTSGIRLWLDRPWYSSGSGETLAVICWARTRVRAGEAERYLRSVSRWGTDPVFEAEMGRTKENGFVEGPDMGVIVRSEFTHADPNSPTEIALPVPAALTAGSSVPIQGGPANQPVPAKDSSVPATAPTIEDLRLGIAVHQPKFHPEERLWYCDIFLRPQRYTPFVRFSVARYQPFALPTCALSEAVQADPMQLHPPRSLEIAAEVNGVLQLDLTLSGIFPADYPTDRRLVLCRIERFCDAFMVKGKSEFSEFGWEAIATADQDAMNPQTNQSNGSKPNRSADSDEVRARIAEVGRRDLPGIPFIPDHIKGRTVYRLATKVVPDSDWDSSTVLSVVVCEYELYPTAYVQNEGQTWAPRLVYADRAVLPSELMRRLVDGRARSRTTTAKSVFSRPAEQKAPLSAPKRKSTSKAKQTNGGS